MYCSSYIVRSVYFNSPWRSQHLPLSCCTVVVCHSADKCHIQHVQKTWFPIKAMDWQFGKFTNLLSCCELDEKTDIQQGRVEFQQESRQCQAIPLSLGYNSTIFIWEDCYPLNIGQEIQRLFLTLYVNFVTFLLKKKKLNLAKISTIESAFQNIAKSNQN